MVNQLGAKRFVITAVYVGLIFLFLLFALFFGAFGMRQEAQGLLWLKGIFTIVYPLVYPLGYAFLYHG